MALKIRGLHSPSDLAVFVHTGCRTAFRCYVTKVMGVVGLRDSEVAICPTCGEPFTIRHEVVVKCPGIYPILST